MPLLSSKREKKERSADVFFSEVAALIARTARSEGHNKVTTYRFKASVRKVSTHPFDLVKRVSKHFQFNTFTTRQCI